MEFTPEYLASLKAEYGGQANDAQITLWVEECKLRGLMPQRDVVLQIRAVSEWNQEKRAKEFVKKAVYITTIQALRKLAERTGKYAGQLPSRWIYLDEAGSPTIESEIPLPETGSTATPRMPWAAKASILRKGFDQPMTVPARFEAYAQYFVKDNNRQLNQTWATRGPEQLEKCAEALALRKAFPEELGGLYLQEELNDGEAVQAVVQPEPTQVNPAVPVPVDSAPKKRGRPKKGEDTSKPWGGEFEQKSASVQPMIKSGILEGPIEPEDSANQPNAVAPAVPVPVPASEQEGAANPPAPPASNLHGVDITDSDLPDMRATKEELAVIGPKIKALIPEGSMSKLGAYIKKTYNVEKSTDIRKSQWDEVIQTLEAAKAAGKIGDILG